ncbi:MAG: hypothetical protein FWD02_05265 [Bacteroidales bacterium]|nr:hypothetical protein [Bacteroidales bacterium]
MKKYLNIIMILGILLATASCREEQEFRWVSEIQFGTIGGVANANSVQFDGSNQATIRAVTFTVNPLADTGQLVFDLNIALLLRGEVNEPVNFTVALMPDTDAQFFPGTDTARSANSTAANAITLNGNAASDGASGTIAVGQTTGSVEVRVDWSALIAGGADRYGARNRVYLLLTSDHPSIPASQAQRRIRLNFTRTVSAPAIAAPTFGASFFFVDLNSNVTAQGTSEVTQTGFIYATDTVGGRAAFRLGSAGVNQVDSTRTGHTGAFTNRTGIITGNGATRIWVRAFAINGTDTIYSPALTAAPATVTTVVFGGGTTTLTAPNFTLHGLDTARVIYSLTAVADTFRMNMETRALADTIQQTGIIWLSGNTPALTPTLTNGTVVPGNLRRMGADTLLVSDFGMTGDGFLVFRSFATSFSGLTTLGPIQSVRVQAPIGRTLDVQAPSITDSSAILRGQLDFNGGIALSEAGFLLGTSAGLNWTTNDTIIRVATVPTAAMNHTVGRGLLPSTTYYVRAFFRNHFGVLVLGDEMSFTTLAAPPPPVED